MASMVRGVETSLRAKRSDASPRQRWLEETLGQQALSFSCGERGREAKSQELLLFPLPWSG